jgi:hypothetical protein
MSLVPSCEIFGNFVGESKGAKRLVIFIPDFGIIEGDMGIIQVVGGGPRCWNFNGG